MSRIYILPLMSILITVGLYIWICISDGQWIWHGWIILMGILPTIMLIYSLKQDLKKK